MLRIMRMLMILMMDDVGVESDGVDGDDDEVGTVMIMISMMVSMT